MKVVAPSARPREIADALNTQAARIAKGVATLGAGTETVVVNPRIGPDSFVVLTPRSIGAQAELVLPVAGDGIVTLKHSSQEGQVFGYLVVN